MIESLAIVLAALGLFAAVYLVGTVVVRRLRPRPVALGTEPIPAAWDGIIARSVPLARGLSTAERERLLRLVQAFLREKHFEGCAGLAVTEAMQVTIAAQACLLLLHWDGPYYPTLKTVLVYPGAFVPKYVRSPEAGHIAQPPVPLKGESWGDGVVVISWDDVVKGGADPADGQNVVLHEFAHQLDHEDGASDGTPVLSGGALRAWGRILAGEYERLRRDAAAGRPSALDAYGATNKAEFFAVATETFFERPVQLEREHPELYAQLREFYQQDPARRTAPDAA